MGPKTLIVHQDVLFTKEEDSLQVHPRFEDLARYAERKRIPLYVIGDITTICNRLSHIVKDKNIIPDVLGEIYGWVAHISGKENVSSKKILYLDSCPARLRAAHNAGAATDAVLPDVCSLEDAVTVVCTGSITRPHVYKTLDTFLESLVKPPRKV